MADVQNITVNSLSGPHRKALQALRRPILDAAKGFEAIREKLSDLAPRMVKLYNAILGENERFTFVEFVRMFDPTVPTHAADRDQTVGYRNHRVYYTMAYMRRLVVTQSRPRGQQGVRDSATDALARTLATVLQVVEDAETVWKAIQDEFQFSERLMTRLRKRVDATKPLIKLAAKTPIHAGSVIHMERVEAPAAASTEPLAQPGRRVTLPAPSEGPRARAPRARAS